MKKGAVAGAIVWSAPILTSTPAFAATAKCAGSRPCTTFYYFKYDLDVDPGEDPCSFESTGDDGSCQNIDELPLEDATCPGAPTIELVDGCSKIISATYSGTQVTVVMPPGSVPVILRLKPGPNCSSYVIPDDISDDPNDPTTLDVTTGEDNSAVTAYVYVDEQTNNVVFVANKPGGNAISHFSFVFCL